jgi:hypothetical protein
MSELRVVQTVNDRPVAISIDYSAGSGEIVVTTRYADTIKHSREELIERESLPLGDFLRGLGLSAEECRRALEG